jgi:predicted lysophospholipase L1 biosynthesis ABC-type transport system permease subunit
MSLEEARKGLLIINRELFNHGGLSQGSSIRISKKLLKVIDEIENEIDRAENQRSVREGDEDLQMVY